MDRTLHAMAEFSHELGFGDVPVPVATAAMLRLSDAVACAVGGYGCAAAEAGRRTAPRVERDGIYAGHWLGGDATPTSLEHAAFVNSAMIRYLDYNDTYPGGHPSDALGGLLPLASSLRSSGPDLLSAMIVGYEIFVRLARSARLREHGWDQGFGVGLATAAGAARLLKLDKIATRHALSIAAVSIMPMRATRAGALSLWKGAATAFAAKSALHATFLAAEGVTGPEAPIEGRHGLMDLVTGEFDLEPLGMDEESFFTPRVNIKFWPVEYNLQAVVWCAIELRQLVTLDEIESVAIDTYWSAWHETASESAKWDPQTRETADHSMPYVLAYVLGHGDLTVDAFEPAAFLDPALRSTMKKITVKTDDEIEARFPDEIVLRATVVTTRGESHVVQIENPLGHRLNPLDSEQFAKKFDSLVSPALGAAPSDRARTALEGIASAADVRPVFALFEPLSRQSPE